VLLQQRCFLDMWWHSVSWWQYKLQWFSSSPLLRLIFSVMVPSYGLPFSQCLMDCAVCALVSSHIIQNSYFLLLLSKYIRSWLLVGSDIHLFIIMSIPDVEATQPSIQLVLKPSCYHNWSLNLTTHFHLVLKLIINRALSPSLHKPFNSVVLQAGSNYRIFR
jgi:hypothetical protein